MKESTQYWMTVSAVIAFLAILVIIGQVMPAKSCQERRAHHFWLDYSNDC